MSPRSEPPTTAVVTVSYGSGAVLPAFLASLPAASAQPVLGVVVDNRPGEDHGVEQLVRATSASYLALDGNPGYGGAVNAALSGLPAEVRWVLVSNPDVELGTGAIDRLIATAEGDERIGAVGPMILSAEGNVYPSARAVPSLRTGIGHALFVNIWASNPWTRAYRRELVSTTEPSDAGWLSGACVLVRRRAFDEIGGFDEGYFMYFEDVDLGYRLGRAGYRNVYEPRATAVHSGAHSTSSEAESDRMIRAHHDSARRFLDRKYRGIVLLPLRVVLRAGLAVRSRLLARRVRNH